MLILDNEVLGVSETLNPLRHATCFVDVPETPGRRSRTAHSRLPCPRLVCRGPRPGRTGLGHGQPGGTQVGTGHGRGIGISGGSFGAIRGGAALSRTRKRALNAALSRAAPERPGTARVNGLQMAFGVVLMPVCRPSCAIEVIVSSFSWQTGLSRHMSMSLRTTRRQNSGLIPWTLRTSRVSARMSAVRFSASRKIISTNSCGDGIRFLGAFSHDR